MLRASLLLGILAPLAATPVFAQSAGAGDVKVDAGARTLELYQSLKEARDAVGEGRRAAYEALEAAGRSEEAMKAYREAMEALSAELEPLEDEFREAFAASDWASWSVDEHAELLEQGLMSVGMHAREEHPDQAVRAFETLVERLPESESAKTAARYFLPALYLAENEPNVAIREIAKLVERVPESERASLEVSIGDAHALAGELEAARDVWQATLEGLPGELERGDARAMAQRDLELRLALVGRPAPEVDSATWLGGEARPLSELRGQVVVLDFWATWCGPCRVVMPGLDAMAQRLEPKGLRVLGVTRFYSNGYMIEGPEMTAGHSVKDMDEEAFMAHLAEFKETGEIFYPFVVGVEADFESYHVSGIPTVVVVGRDGIVRMVIVGSGKERMLERAVAGALEDRA